MDILSIIGLKTRTCHRAPLNSAMLVGTAAVLAFAVACAAPAQALTPQQQRAFDIYKELVEINTVTQTGDTARAADAMAARLIAAGFDSADVQVFKPAPRKGNLVARLRGTGARKPILLLAHLDVVEARSEDWSVDPSGSLRRTATSTAAAPGTTNTWRRASWRISSATSRRATGRIATSSWHWRPTRKSLMRTPWEFSGY